MIYCDKGIEMVSIKERIIMNKKERALEIIKILEEEYGTDYVCYLNHENAWQLLFATILSAQCTDARVNIVTESLFKKYPSVEAFAKADIKELEQDIKPTGFYHNKAKNLIECAKGIIERFNGEVPSELEDLISLAGVGRKTANVVLAEGFNVPRIAVDTHVERVSKRLELVEMDKSVLEVEKELMILIPKEKWHQGHHYLLFFGRYLCTARNPKCATCFNKNCKYKI